MTPRKSDNTLQVTRYRRAVERIGDSVITRPEKKIVADADDNTYRFPWYTPTKDKVESGKMRLFPEEPSDSDLEYRYGRYQLAKVIVNDVAEDALRYGFTIGSAGAKDEKAINAKFQQVYSDSILSPLLRGVKYCRLWGFSDLYFGYKDDEEVEGLSKPVAGNPKIEFIEAFRKPEITLRLSEGLPRRLESVDLKLTEESILNVHPERIVHLENEALTRDREGMSCLMPVWDLLTVQKNADWAIGQDLWRGASGLMTLFAPEGATGSDAETALSAIENLHAKSRLALPPGWTAKDMSPARVAYNVRYAYEIVVNQIAVGTRLPISVLTPWARKKGVPVDSEYLGFLYSYQTTFIGPILKKIFRRFQRAEQLPEGDFEILWRTVEGSPWEEAKKRFMEAEADYMRKKTEVDLPAKAVEIEKKLEGAEVPDEEEIVVPEPREEAKSE